MRNGIYVPVTCGDEEFVGPGGVCTGIELTAPAGACAQGGVFWNGQSCQDTGRGDVGSKP